MSFKLPDLPYEYDALEPYIDARTMEIHHSKHHAAYTNNLNNLIAGTDAGSKLEKATELGIKILKYENAFYCNECKKIVLEKECRHGKKARVDISGNKLREKLTNGEIIPKEFVRKEVAEYLRAKRKNIFC